MLQTWHLDVERRTGTLGTLRARLRVRDQQRIARLHVLDRQSSYNPSVMNSPSSTPCSYSPAALGARRSLSVAVLILGLWLALPGVAPATPPPLDISPLEPASSGGIAALDRALVRLASHRRLLVIAAHPDDEDTTLLTAVARGQGGEAAYLSLSRGDGGQNLIGREVGPDLGILRSRELGAARRVDGARQYFSRAYDFGYTRSLDEALERWPKDVLLEDAVRIVRRFKPQILMAVFPPTPAAGHGQHQASGWVAEQIFELAADPGAFPQLLHEGLPPWRIDTFYRGAWWAPDATAVETPMGIIEPWSGRSILQIALESRSQHRCQDMGSIQPLGDFTGRLQWTAGLGSADQPLWSASNTHLSSIATLIPSDSLRQQVADQLVRAEALAQEARTELRPGDTSAARRALHDILRGLEMAHRLLLEGSSDGGSKHAAELVEEKIWLAREALANASHILVDAVTDDEIVVPGSQLDVRSIFWNAGTGEVEDLQVEIVNDQGWKLQGSRDPEAARSRFRTQVSDERILQIAVPEAAPPSVPYFLAKPRQGDLYDWDGVPSEVRGEPFAPAPLQVRFRFLLDGTPLQLQREVVSRQRDQARGEVRRPLRTVPAIEVTVGPDLVVLPLNDAGASSRRLQVDIASNVETPQRLQLEWLLPEGWTAPELPGIEIQEPFGKAQVEVPVLPPDNLESGRYHLALRVTDGAGKSYDTSYPLIDYEHIRPTPRPRRATVDVVAADIQRPGLERIGYVRGASDSMPELLTDIGFPIEVLSEDQMTAGDLSVFDAIVIGSRAYEIDASLVRANPRLLAYVKAGGLLIVQYQQYQFVRGGFAPHPLDIHRPHDRITDETAAVTLLEPGHPVFNSPNVLGDDDWLDWVQERGLYFAGTWNDAYRPLLSMADPDGQAKHGGLLVASHGQGTYVYTGLAFFRQLPAGIPGAYRLFANLLSLRTPAAQRAASSDRTPAPMEMP